MTTVAAKDGCMAADTQLTGEYRVRAQKIIQLQDGSLVGGAGAWGRCWAAMLWMLGGEQGDAPKLKGGCLLIMRPDGGLWMVEEEFPAFPLLDREAAIGSGSAAAMTAMRAGASAADAVKQAARIDCATSDPIQMLRLPAQKKTPKRKTK